MSKVELAGRPEPGYESMEQFSVSVSWEKFPRKLGFPYSSLRGELVQGIVNKKRFLTMWEKDI